MIYANLATIPGRETELQKVIDSLLPQVDMINIIFNGHKEIPIDFDKDKMNIVFSDNSFHDTAMFWFCHLEGYHLICGDDIEYPPTYAQDMIKAVDKYEYAVSLMGRNYPTGEIKSFYKDFNENYRALNEVKNDVEVELLGTCAAAFHSDFLQVEPDINYRAMADILFSIRCKEQSVKKMVLKHPINYLKYLLDMAKPTIFKEFRDNDKKQTELFNRYLR